MAAEQKKDRPATGGAVLRQRVTEAITEAAFAELAGAGYTRMSMESVARRAGVGKAALYRRWSSKQAMVTELIRGKVADTLPPTPATGALHTDLRELLITFRGQLANPLLARIAAGLLAEASHDGALAEGLYTGVTAPRRAAAHAILRGAIDRGELPPGLDLDLGTDLLIAPLAFRVLVIQGRSDDEYLETLTNAIEAALRAAVR
ncbi:TetR/AcrR family transcriptional regulator [Streptomyces rugosispiralis]|uniref:TetR/AcrR family transcriptional regulator n=1 Tax=Streptomyces rugosispiralis TaxID=2967341 RepID=A0ABT1URN2_9ACTN|nr:TetR/AcrR family transcriptional regulator [Streptomyces rugosispiralis]MCQ8187759.1 TetR/AcrR family transcriptional regulator [Streptomyces rugosispiralis]